MKSIRKLLALFLAVVLLLSAAATVSADDAETNLIRQMLNYFSYYECAAATDIARLNAQLAELDPEQAAIWDEIMDYVLWVNGDMTINYDVLPDGLPEDDSLCIVVLGFALKNNGTMQNELLGRLEVALASAEKYPNAYVLCTGGGTARDNPSVTEAGQMAAWLKDQGIDESRIIVEDDSKTTTQNALFSCDILADQYPQVQQLAMVTSDYHLYRGSVLFFAESRLNGCGYDIVGYAGHDTGCNEPERASLQAGNLARLANTSIEKMTKPPLSTLTGITAECITPIEAGSAPELTVTASYDSGFSRIITGECFLSGFDAEAVGTQTLTLTYTENDITCTDTVEIEVLPLPTEAPTQPAPTEETIPQITEPEPGPEIKLPFIVYPLAVLLLLLPVLMLTVKRRKK